MTADSLRDRIAAAIEAVSHEPGSGTPCDLCLETADAVMAVLADADPTDIGLIEMEVITHYEGGPYLAEPVPYLTPVRWVDGYDEHRPHDLRIYARPRTEEAHTVDVGHVHVLAEPGGPCAPGCPHPDHRTEETTDA